MTSDRVAPSGYHLASRAATIATAMVIAWASSPALLAEDFETPGTLGADRFLAADELAGADWRVDPKVANDGFANTYRVTSRFGDWETRGRAQTLLRIGEIRALAQLEEVSKSDVFVEAVATSATAPIRLFQSVAEKPVETLEGIPSGVGRWFKKTGFKLSETYHDVAQSRSGGSEHENGEATGGSTTDRLEEEGRKRALSYLRITKAERGWYARLGVDPYTDNEALREAVTSVARVEGLTSFSMRFVGLPSVPGAAEMRRTMDLVWGTDPWELRLRNRKLLLAAGLSEETARSFEDNPKMRLSLQTALLGSLQQLDSVAGREHMVARAIAVETPSEARALVAAAALLARFHRDQEPLRELVPGTRLPVARTAGDRLVAVLMTDAIFWTAEVAGAAREFAAAYADLPVAERRLLLAGEASPGFREGARRLGWEVRDRWQLGAAEDRQGESSGTGR